MATDARKDPFRGYNFRLELERTSVAGFSECSGLNFTVDPVEYREGTDVPLHVRKLVGMPRFKENIKLARGMTNNLDLYHWYQAVLDGDHDVYRSGAVVLQNELHASVMRWEFSGAFPCGWRVSEFKAVSNDVVIETLEICVERVELK